MEKKEFVLPEKTIIVKPIIRKDGQLPDGHDGKFMYTGASRWYTAPVGPNNQIVRVLTEEEQEFFEKKFGLAEGDMSPTREKNNYWANREIALERYEKPLVLSNAEDYIAYKILLSNTNKIAPTWEQRFERGTYKFALVDTHIETKNVSAGVQLKMKAFDALKKIATLKQKMIDAIMVYRISVKDYAKLPLIIDKDSLFVILNDIIEKDPQGFISIFEDKDYDIKVLVQKLIKEEIAVINPLQNNRYQIHGTDLLGYPIELVKLLKDPINEATKARLLMQIKEKDSTE